LVVYDAAARHATEKICRKMQNTGKSELLERGQLTETAPKILHPKGCFEAFCETVMKIRTLALISTLEELADVQGGLLYREV
jgi:hypothetical protein